MQRDFKRENRETPFVALVKKVVFDEVQCSPHEFHNPVLDVCET